MQDKRTTLAIFLSIIVIVIYSEFILPKPERKVVVEGVNQTENITQTNNTPLQYQGSNVAPVINQNVGNASANQNIVVNRNNILSAPSITVENSLYTAQISLLGGRLTSFKLKNYKEHLNQKEDLNLVSVSDSNFPLGVLFSNTSDIGLSYQIPQNFSVSGAVLNSSTYTVNAGQTFALSIDAVLPDGNQITKQFNFRDDSYLIDLNVNFAKPLADGSNAWLEWEEYLPHTLESLRWNPRSVELLDSANKISRTPIMSIPATPTETPTRWLGLGDSYFMAVLIGQNAGQMGTFIKNADIYTTRIRGLNQSSVFQIYIGPKEYERLSLLGNDLYKAVDLGYFAFVGEPILIGLHFLYTLLGNYGLAIILLTLIIKSALLPLTKTSFKSMKAMQDLQPEITALREKTQDPTKLNQEIMQLYQKRGVNPMGGCFPILLQMPIFLGMYNALQRSIELRHADFALWINDLSAPEGLNILGIKVPVMIILMGISMLWQQITTPSTADPAQKRIMYMVPVIFTVMFMIYPFPSGLVLYWLVNNIISIVQQVSLRKGTDANPLKATLVGSVVIFVVGFFVTLV